MLPTVVAMLPAIVAMSPSTGIPPLAVLGALTAFALLLVFLSLQYRAVKPRPLPRRRGFQWFPKYWIEVPIHADPGNDELLQFELLDWLGPMGFELQNDSQEAMTFMRRHRLGNLSSAGAYIAIKVPRPTANPLRLVLQYNAGVVFDTGDLLEFGLGLLDRFESDDGSVVARTPRTETQNPYQSPGI
ncbi:MAG: hypothetical protein KDB14_21235 [Planctomycetales bacterium]|nr:hypothetical protein [Planctomycetales bacterium]